VFGWRMLTCEQLLSMRPYLEESCEDKFDFSDGGSMADVSMRDLREAHGDSPFLQGGAAVRLPEPPLPPLPVEAAADPAA
jgi:hypothetical protein